MIIITSMEIASPALFTKLATCIGISTTVLAGTAIVITAGVVYLVMKDGEKIKIEDTLIQDLEKMTGQKINNSKEFALVIHNIIEKQQKIEERIEILETQFSEFKAKRETNDWFANMKITESTPITDEQVQQYKDNINITKEINKETKTDKSKHNGCHLF